MDSHIKPRVLVSWSSGKDSAWTLHRLRTAGIEPVGLLVSLTARFDHASMHGTRRAIIQAQAEAAGLPLHIVELPWPSVDGDYARVMGAAMARAAADGVTHVAFGDLYLPDIRRYREDRLAQTDIRPMFPLWTTHDATGDLAREMIAAGLRARLSCVDPRQLDPSFVGREFNQALLDDLPPGVDPCGENGEFHTICYAGPMFSRDLDLEAGIVTERDGFWYADFHLPERHGHALSDAR